MSSIQVGHPVHTLPKEYVFDDVIMGDMIANRATIQGLKDGKGPDYEVLVSSYPRSGTARVVEICWLLMNNCDVQKAKDVPQTGRHIYLDLSDPTFTKSVDGKPLLKENMRLSKTHFPVSLMEKHVNRGTKIVVGLRNPKDNLVSLYHFYRMNATLGKFDKSWDEFFKLFKDKHIMYGDIFDFSVGWWNLRNRGNILYVFFEDLAEDPLPEVRKINDFLGTKASEADIQKVIEWTTFGNMKESKSTNYTNLPILDMKVSPYMRKGQVGDWKNYFNEEQSKYVDDLDKKTCLPIGLKFRYEI